jgi:hypothetical protein
MYLQDLDCNDGMEALELDEAVVVLYVWIVGIRQDCQNKRSIQQDQQVTQPSNIRATEAKHERSACFLVHTIAQLRMQYIAAALYGQLDYRQYWL